MMIPWTRASGVKEREKALAGTGSGATDSAIWTESREWPRLGSQVSMPSVDRLPHSKDPPSMPGEYSRGGGEGGTEVAGAGAAFCRS